MVAMFSLAFVLQMPAQSQSDLPISPPSALPETQLLQMQIRLVQRLSERSLQIKSLQDSLQQVSERLKEVNDNYQAASQSALTLKVELTATSNSQEKWKKDYASLQAKTSKQAADDAATIKRVTRERDIAIAKAGRWWLWLILGIIAGGAVDEGAHRAGWIK